MLRNESGFAFLEGIFSFSFIVLIALSFFPLMFTMISNLHEVKKEVVAYRLLYEHVEQQTALGRLENGQVTWRNVKHEMFMEANAKGDWKACIQYEKKTRCVGE